MNRAVVDASVWVSAVHRDSPHRADSAACLIRLRELQWEVVVPAIARVEVACGLARRWRNPARARRVSETLLRTAGATEQPLNRGSMERALLLGTERFLRSGDAVYAAEAVSSGIPFISWDAELIQRAGAMSPATWLLSHS
jgi:predicted nucleic acid-binding protein